MAWSIFKQGGGKQVAVGWAQQLLTAIGAPQSPGNIQFVYDWELAEGGGGAFNPLNQGPVPGHPELTTTGQQFGGGAADFASWDAGLKGAVDYLNMSHYRGILSALKANNPVAARQALIASPWAANHYGGNFPNSPVPGGTPVLPGTGGATGATPTGFGLPNPLDPKTWIDGFLTLLGVPDLKDLGERLGLILLGGALIFIGLHILGFAPTKTAVTGVGGGNAGKGSGMPKTGKSGSAKSTAVKAAIGATPEGKVAETVSAAGKA